MPGYIAAVITLKNTGAAPGDISATPARSDGKVLADEVQHGRDSFYP